jgi:hypothetical protein
MVVMVVEKLAMVMVVVVVLNMTCVTKENCFWLLAAAFCSTHSSRENTSMTCSSVNQCAAW